MAIHNRANKFRVKSFSNKLLSATALTAAGMVMLAGTAVADNWTDHTAVVGSISIDTTVPSITNITQNTDFVRVNGNGDINAGWTVNVFQPGSSSIYALYDSKDDPTRILGTLNANGQIYIFDQNGVIFGTDSRVDVGSLVVSTGQISDADILNNDGKLTFTNVGNGKIELNGSITVADAGLAAFVSPFVANNGVINAKMGKVAIGAGEKVTLDLYGDNLIEIAVDDKLSDALIENAGTINAQGGTISIKAEAAKATVDNVINMTGVVNASSATVKGGKIVLGGGSDGTVNVSGRLEASGSKGGGSIKTTGQNVQVTETAEVKADAIDNGDGGRIDLIADKNMSFQGYVSAKGGSKGGNGGSAEISGYETLGFNGLVDMSAEKGDRGNLLLDPAFSVIHSGTVPFGLLQNYIISANALALSLASTNITLQADNFIDVGARASGYANQGWTGNASVDAIITAGLNNLSDGDIDLSTWNFFGFGGETNGSLTLDSNAVNFNRNLTMGNGDLVVTAGNGGINWNANTTMLGSGDINATTLGAITFTDSVLRTAGNISLLASGNIRQSNNAVTGLVANRFSAESANGSIDLQAQNDFEIIDDIIAKNSVTVADRVGGVTVDGTVSGSNISLSSQNGDMHVNGNMNAAGNLRLFAQSGKTLYLNDGSSLKGNAVSLSVEGGALQHVGSSITANTLTGSTGKAGANIILDGANNLTTLGNITVNRGDFRLNELDGFTLTGNITTKSPSVSGVGGSVTINTHGTSHAQMLTMANGSQILSHGGNIDINTNGGTGIVKGGSFTVNGVIDARGTAGTGNVNITSRQLALNGNSRVYADVLKTDGALVNQSVNGVIEANGLTGTLASHASFLGANNNVVTLHDFTTGLHNSLGKSFALVDNGGLLIDGNVSSNGGDISIDSRTTNWNQDVRLNGGKTIASKGGDISIENSAGRAIIGGTLDARGSLGDINVTAAEIQLHNGGNIFADTLTLNATSSQIWQTAANQIHANLLTGSSKQGTSLIGTSNNIGALGDFATGVSWNVGGFNLINASSKPFNIVGALTTQGGNVSILHNNRMDVRSTGSIVTKGGDVDLTVDTNSFIYADGLIDTRDAGGNGTVTLASGSNIEMRNGGKIYAGLVNLISGNIVNQAVGAFIDADKLEGTVDKNINLNGSGNAIRSIGNVTTGAHSIASVAGGFKLVNSVDTDVVGALLGGQGNISLDVDGDVNIVSGAKVDAEGGNVDIKQSGVFKSVANTLKTSGTGTINVEQRAGGSINQAINAFDNTGTGKNTVLVHDGIYNENVQINDSNVDLVSANGRENTKIIGDNANVGAGTVHVANGVNNVRVGDVGKGFHVVGFDSPNPAIEKAAIYISGSNSNITVVGNEIEANGEAGLLTEYGYAIDNMLVDSNIFSGQTFVGPNPAQGDQFEVHNVPRALLFVGGSNGGQNKTNITVTNNQFSGVVGGITAADNAYGNTAVTVDAHGAVIQDNTFDAGVYGNAYLLRTRGINTDISGNVFDSANLHGAGYFFASANALGNPSTIPGVYANNTFIGNSVYADAYNSNQIIHTKIQPVIDAAAAGATVTASAGDFEEQLSINKNLTLTGAGAGNTVIQSPTSLALNFGAHRGIIYATNANNINVKNLTVDGLGRGNGNDRVNGILYVNAGGVVDSVHVTNVKNTPLSNVQHGNAIMGRNTDSVSRDWTIINSTVDEFQKNGITADGAGLNASVLNNVIKGVGPVGLGLAAQNGVQISNGAVGVVDGNTISDIGYTYPSYVATGVALSNAGAGTVVSNNIFNGTGYDYSVYAYNSADAVITGNLINGAKTGILAYDSNNAIISENDIGDVDLGIWVHGSGNVDISDNTISNAVNGIKGGSSNGLNIVRNSISNTSGDGISVEDGVSIKIGGSIDADGNAIKNAGGNGIYTNNTNGVIIQRNTVEDTTLNNIWADNSNNVTIINNEVSGTSAHAGIAVRNVNGAIINNNIIDNAKYGLYADGNSLNISAHGNSVTNISGNYVWNNGTPSIFNASGNWWGTSNEANIASKMIGAVDFSPYLGTGIDSSIAKGFQGDFSHVFATTLGQQVGTKGRIQEAIDAIVDGARVAGNRLVNLNDGTYNESGILVNKSLTMDGLNTNDATKVIIKGAGATDGLNLSADDLTLRYFTVEGHRNGIYTNSQIDNIFLRNVNVRDNANYGFTIHNNAVVTKLDMRNVRITGNKIGLRFRGSADDVRIDNGTISNNGQGIEAVADANGSTYLNNLRISGTMFANNSDKGIYLEKLSNSTFNGIEVRNSGIRNNYANNAGIDINLKYGDFENIMFNNININGSGRNGTGVGNALTVKARNDGAYAANPASLKGLVIKNSSIDTTGDYAIAIGNNVSDVTIENNDIDGKSAIYMYGGVNDVAINDNIIAASVDGIWGVNSDNVTVTGNTISGSDYGIAFGGSNNVTIGGAASELANLIKDVAFGIFMYGSNGVVTDNHIEGNEIHGVSSQAIHIRDNQYANIINNNIYDANIGITAENFSQAAADGDRSLIDGNTISAKSIGIRNNLSYGTQTGFMISNNTITAEDPASSRRWTGVDIVTQQGGEGTIFLNNIIDGSAVTDTRLAVGYEGTYLTAGNTVIDGGEVKNVKYGVWATDGSFYTGAVNDLLVQNVAFSDIGEAAILVEDVIDIEDPTKGVNATGTKITIGSGNTFANTPYELALAGKNASVNGNAVHSTLVKAAGLSTFVGAPSGYAGGQWEVDNASIQNGVNATAANGKVTVEAGTFTEQVNIGKNLTLQGQGAGNTILKAPMTMTNSYTQDGRSNYSVIYAYNADNVNIDGFEIDGSDNTDTHFNDDRRFVGVSYQNAGGNFTNNVVKNIGTPGNAKRTGFGLLASAKLKDSVLNIDGNEFSGFQTYGIAVADGKLSVTITNNDISSNGVGNQSGIYAISTKSLTVGGANAADGNNISSVRYGIESQKSPNALIQNNEITDITSAVYLYDTNGAKIIDNTIDGSTGAAIHLKDRAQNIVVSGNAVSNAKTGILSDKSGSSNGLIEISGNILTNNETGMHFKSGTIDLSGDANEIIGGTTGIIFDPGVNAAPSVLSVVNNTIGSTSFSGQSGNYITLLNGAFFAPAQPSRVDAINARFAGISAADFVNNILTPEQIEDIEDKIWHNHDDNTLGIVRFRNSVPVIIGITSAPFDTSGLGNGVEQEKVFFYFTPSDLQTSGFNVTISGLPSTANTVGGAPSSPQALNSISPNAGDIEASLNNIETAAGGNETTGNSAAGNARQKVGEPVKFACWEDVAGQSFGQTVSISYGTSMEDALITAAACGLGA